MKVEEVLRMAAGNETNSYAENSEFQEEMTTKARFLVRRTVTDLYSNLLPEKFVVADLGCSSGPNAFIIFGDISDSIKQKCDQLNRTVPEMHLFLNDLPGNDFNTLFRTSLSSYKKQELAKGEGGKSLPFSVAGVPGSFYERLFPRESVHFIYSAFSVHWLSKVPEGLHETVTNTGNIYISRTSPPLVPKLYMEQFQRDFHLFLRLRSEEMCSEGRMVLIFAGRMTSDPAEEGTSYMWTWLAEALNEMVSKGAIKASEVDSFDLPHYCPCMEEVRAIVQKEASFELIEEHAIQEDDRRVAVDKAILVEKYVKDMRALIEPTLAQHFGEALMDDVFSTFAAVVAGHLQVGAPKFSIIAVSLRRKE